MKERRAKLRVSRASNNPLWSRGDLESGVVSQEQLGEGFPEGEKLAGKESFLFLSTVYWRRRTEELLREREECP